MGTLVLQICETLLDEGWSWTAFWTYWEDDAAWAFGAPAITDICPTCFGVLALTGSLLEKMLNAFSDVMFTMTVLMWYNLVSSFLDDMMRTTNNPEDEDFHPTVVCMINNLSIGQGGRKEMIDTLVFIIESFTSTETRIF